MIYYNKGDLKTDGDFAEILADLSTILHVFTLQVSKTTGKNYKDSLEFLTTSIICPMLELHEEEKHKGVDYHTISRLFCDDETEDSDA